MNGRTRIAVRERSDEPEAGPATAICWKCARTTRAPLLWTLQTGKEVPVHPRCWAALRKRAYGLEDEGVNALERDDA